MNIRAQKGIFALTGEGAEIYNETLNEMVDVTGATNKAFGTQEKSSLNILSYRNP